MKRDHMNDDSWMRDPGIIPPNPIETWPQRDTPEPYSAGLEKGINFAVGVIRRALTGEDPGLSNETYANPKLEELRRDILELRRNAQQLLELGAKLSPLVVNRAGFSAGLNPMSPEVREFLMNPKPGQIINVPEHRLKDHNYERARLDNMPLRAARDPAELGYDGAFGRGPNEPPADYQQLPKGESCPRAWSDAQGNQWCPHGPRQGNRVELEHDVFTDRWRDKRSGHSWTRNTIVTHGGRLDVV